MSPNGGVPRKRDQGLNSRLSRLKKDTQKILKIKERRAAEGLRQLKFKDIKVYSNPEDFFLATASVKYKGDAAAAAAKKGPKKPRKGNRTGTVNGSNLPERSLSNFSVSKESANITSTDGEAIPEKHFDEVDNLLKDIYKDFTRWIYILREGYNIILYGYGSKLPVFEEFIVFLNDEFTVITVNGLFPKVNPRKLLTAFWDALEFYEDEDVNMPRSSTVWGLADEMYNVLLKRRHPSMFLLVSNIEILAVKHQQYFRVLCSIARVPFVHLVSSCDHNNSFLGINQGKAVQLNFTWVDATSFSHFDHELTWKQGTFGSEGKKSNSKSTLDHVLKSLTENARKAFKILASLQLTAMKLAGKTKSKDFAGIKFRELSRRCREAFIANTDMGLKALLTEFIDHKLVLTVGRNKKTDNILVIDLDLETLEKLAEGV